MTINKEYGKKRWKKHKNKKGGGGTCIKFQSATEKESAASKRPPRTQNSGAEEKTKSCLVCRSWWEEGLMSGPLKNSATTAPIMDTTMPITWTWIPDLLKFNSVSLIIKKKKKSIKLIHYVYVYLTYVLHGTCWHGGKYEEIKKQIVESFEEPENDWEEEIKRWDQEAHGTYKYWWTVA